MFKENNKLPEIKYLMEVDENFKSIINFLQSGSYEGDVSSNIEEIENIIYRYKGSSLFINSNIFNNLEYFINNICCCAYNGSFVKLTNEQAEAFREVAENIILEYRDLMNKYMK